MKKQTIAVDVDEVLFPLLTEFIRFHDAKYQTNLTFDQFVTYKIEDVMGISVEEAMARLNAFQETDYLHVEPLSEAQAVLRHLGERYELIVITARNARFEKSTRAWLDKNFADIFSDVVMVGASDNPGVERTKAEVCIERGVIALIDDSVKYINECMKAGIQGIVFGNYPWTQGALAKGVIRCEDWLEVQEYFDGQTRG